VAGLLLSARRAGDIDRLLPGAKHPAAAAPQQQGPRPQQQMRAGSTTLTADVRTRTCYSYIQKAVNSVIA